MGHLAYKFRFYPTAGQAKSLASQLETLRHVYNACLQYWRDKYEFAKAAGEKSKSPTGSEIYKVFAALRNAQIADKKAGGAGPHWLTHVSAVSMRDTCERVKKAFDNFFRRVREKKEQVGYPRFKGYGRLRSIPFENYNSGCVVRDAAGRPLKANVPAAREGYRLDLFGVGRVKVLAHRDIEGVIKTACVERDVDGKWYVVIVAQTPDVEIPTKEGVAVGIDVGLESFLTDSNGEHRPNPRILKKKLGALRRLQRSSSRKTEVAKRRKAKFRHCKNLQKAFRDVAKLHVRIRNLRREHHHQEANRLVREFATVCVEKLNVRGMVRNSKLSRAISDAGWSAFLNVLKHKAAKAGVRLVEVDASGTSQTCPECGGEVRKTLKERTHNCPHCGYSTHRDHASARVILARGVGSGGAGLVPVGRNLNNSRGVRRISLASDISVVARKGNRSRRSDETPRKRGWKRPAGATESDASG